MAYRELVKNFDKIRDYMREFYVYGFKTRDEYDRKSSRSYDNERRRIESWLGDFMFFRQNADGKNVFISVDSRSIHRNPLYTAFKAKSFTDNDITLHFYLLDLLQENTELPSHEIIEAVHSEYLSAFDYPVEMDDSTIRKKLKEYEELGLIVSRKYGRELFYKRSSAVSDYEILKDAVSFFSEEDPMGVIGSYLADRTDSDGNLFHFKHYYILHALDSSILEGILQGIRTRNSIAVTMITARRKDEKTHTVCPLNILISTQTGREYLLCYHYKQRRPMVIRLDNIHDVKLGEPEPDYKKYKSFGDNYRKNLWGVSSGADFSLDHIEMDIRVGKDEGYIRDRLEREKRCGHIEQVDENTCRYAADVYDASEMLVWIRTFTGRIVRLECSNRYVTEQFREDFRRTMELYGGASE